MKRCPSCGRENPEDANFCAGCATALTDVREERKVVTVLFADLVGSTARAETMDPEDVRARLSRYYSQVRADLERFGGSVEKFIGDAVMAVFGAPVAHEDDPERAVRAALAVRDWAAEQEDIDVRVAVYTGEALVTVGAETLVAGDVVNTAARLQAAAPVNGILVGETTYRATRYVIDYRESDPIVAKGKEAAVAVWEALEARSRIGVDVVQRGRAELIGRDEELETLLTALDRAEREREVQLVTLVGVPGIGKSRLVWELFRAAGQRVTWRQGRSLPYGDGVSFWALGEIVKAQAGILETDSEAQAEAKLRDAVRSLDGDADWVGRHLRPLAGLGVVEVTAERRNEGFAAWRRFFEALAEERPLVLVFEDLHWADDSLLDFVDYLAEWVSGVPLLLVGTARPELLARRPQWGGGKSNAVTLSLSALSDDETGQLVEALLEKNVLPADARVEVFERAGGNPLYAEEFVRMLASGSAARDLPETVQGIIAARLDTLPAEEKGLLQDAAVIGKVFWLGALPGERWTLEERLHALERREFIRRERRSSVAGETEYAFRHVLVRDVAYGQIPRVQRAEKHRRAAAWIESLGRERDHAELLAHHYSTAHELAEAAGVVEPTLASAARRWLEQAGDRATSLNSFTAAARSYAQALELVDAAQRPSLLFKYGEALVWSENRGAEELAEAREALLAEGDRETAARADALLANLARTRDGRIEDAIAYVSRAAELLRDVEASPAKARVLAQLAQVHLAAGEYREAIQTGQAALAMAEQLALADIRAHALNSIGISRVNLGDASGVADLEESLEIALSENLGKEIDRAYNNLAMAYGAFGDLHRARETMEKGLRAAERMGERNLALWLRGNYPDVLLFLGEWDAALERAEEFIREVAGVPVPVVTSCFYVRAVIARGRGNLQGALADAASVAEQDRWVFAPILLALGRREEAADAADAFLAAGNTMSPLDLVLTLVELGKAEDVRRALSAANPSVWNRPAALVLDGQFTEAAEIYEGFGDAYEAALTRLYAAERGHADADDLEKAIAFFRRVSATAYLAEAEALVAASA